MNNAQLTALKAAVLAETNATLVARRTAGNHDGIAKWYNGASTVIVWRSSVAKSDVLEQIAIADLTALTADQRDMLRVYLSGEVVPSNRARVRAAFASLFGASGTATRLAALWKRPATFAEAIFASGGSGTDADPHKLGFEGDITTADLAEALR